jgi:hypothetical protein
MATIKIEKTGFEVDVLAVGYFPLLILRALGACGLLN